MARRSFEILEHPADIGLRAFGGSLEELFSNAALAMLSIAGAESTTGDIEYPLKAAGSDYESLLVAWLSEVLYWLDAKGIGFRSFHVTLLHPDRIEAVGLGKPGHFATLVVKAVTWHQLRIARTADGWMAEVYLDI